MTAALKRFSTAANDATKLFGANVAAGSTVKVYGNPVVNTTAILKHLTLCNPSESAALITVAIKDDASAIALSNSIFYQAYLQAGQTAIIDMSSVIAYNKGLFVKVEAGGGNVNVSAQGVELLNASAKQLLSAMLTDTYSSQYTTPANKESVVYQVFAVNGDSAPVTVSVQIIPASGQLDAKNCILYEVPVQPNETLMFTTKTPLPAGASIAVRASRAGKVHLIIDGTEK